MQGIASSLRVDSPCDQVRDCFDSVALLHIQPFALFCTKRANEQHYDCEPQSPSSNDLALDTGEPGVIQELRASLHRKDPLALAELLSPKRRSEFSSSQPRGRHFVGDQGQSRTGMPSLTRNRMTCRFFNIAWCATFRF
jgi:hypothetical protein